MAARLDLIHLRRHALPAHFINSLAHGVDRPAGLRPERGMGSRPRLLATWRLDAGGRPVCAWSVDADDPA